MKHYVLVGWPEIQDFMAHERWEECVFCIEIEGHPVEDSTYAVPLDLYEEVYAHLSTKKTIEEAADFISKVTLEWDEEDKEDLLDGKLLEIAADLQ